MGGWVGGGGSGGEILEVLYDFVQSLHSLLNKRTARANCLPRS